MNVAHSYNINENKNQLISQMLHNIKSVKCVASCLLMNILVCWQIVLRVIIKLSQHNLPSMISSDVYTYYSFLVQELCNVTYKPDMIWADLNSLIRTEEEAPPPLPVLWNLIYSVGTWHGPIATAPRTHPEPEYSYSFPGKKKKEKVQEDVSH